MAVNISGRKGIEEKKIIKILNESFSFNLNKCILIFYLTLFNTC